MNLPGSRLFFVVHVFFILDISFLILVSSQSFSIYHIIVKERPLQKGDRASSGFRFIVEVSCCGDVHRQPTAKHSIRQPYLGQLHYLTTPQIWHFLLLGGRRDKVFCGERSTSVLKKAVYINGSLLSFKEAKIGPHCQPISPKARSQGQKDGGFDACLFVFLKFLNKNSSRKTRTFVFKKVGEGFFG